MTIKGKAWVYGDDVDTDVIIPARYLNTSDPKELASHCMEDIDKSFAANVQRGDLVVAGNNFGCGSSREHAPIALKATGITGVVAVSFARIFYRNALNIGLPIWECSELAENVENGDEVIIDYEGGKFQLSGKGETYGAKPFPPSMQQLISDGGLVNYVRKRLKESE